MFKIYKLKSEFSNSLFHLMGMSQMRCMHFLPLDRPQSQLLCGIEYVYQPLRGSYPSSIYCDHAKTALIDCCLSLSVLTPITKFSPKGMSFLISCIQFPLSMVLYGVCGSQNFRQFTHRVTVFTANSELKCWSQFSTGAYGSKTVFSLPFF